MVRAMLGGLQKVIHKRLYSDEADQLPRLAEADRRLGPLLPPAPGPARGAATARAQGAAVRRAPGGRPPARAGAAGAGGDRRREGLQGDHGRRGRRAGRHLAAGLLRALREQGRGLPRGARQRLGADAGRRPAGLPPRPQLAGVGARRPTRRCSPSGSKSPSTRGSARSRCTRSASGRCRPATRVMEGLEALLVPGYELAPGHAADRGRGDRRRDLRPDPRPGQEQGAGEPAGTGADGHLHDAGAVRRRRGGLRAGDRGERQMVRSPGR